MAFIWRKVKNNWYHIPKFSLKLFADPENKKPEKTNLILKSIRNQQQIDVDVDCGEKKKCSNQKYIFLI